MKLLTSSFDLAVSVIAQKLAQQPFVADQLIHIAQPVPSLSLLGWLSANQQRQSSCNYWRNRDQTHSIAGLGQCLTFEAHRQEDWPELIEQVRTLCQRHPVAFIGGFSFDGNDGKQEWSGFSSASFQLPAIELSQRWGAFRLGINVQAKTPSEWQQKKQQVLQQLSRLNFPTKNPSKPKNENSVFNRDDNFSYENWKPGVESALDKIDQDVFQKVVLARATRLQFEQPVSDLSTLLNLEQKNPNSFCFLFRRSGKSFLGSSPERLIKRQHQTVETEAMAGTVKRGRDTEEDFRLAQQLQQNDKLCREHQWVGDFIADRLAPFSEQAETLGPVRIFKQSNVQHRYQPINALIKNNVTDYQLLKALHPSPAVCGYPQTNAMAFIHQKECFKRGWYSGAIGAISANGLELAVAIRSALIDQGSVTCYAGVGLVRGSDVESEWLELEAKIQPMLHALSATK